MCNPGLTVDQHLGPELLRFKRQINVRTRTMPTNKTTEVLAAKVLQQLLVVIEFRNSLIHLEQRWCPFKHLREMKFDKDADKSRPYLAIPGDPTAIFRRKCGRFFLKFFRY